MNVALIHYAYPPAIGGVEFVMEQHVGLFARHGNAVRVIAGTGETRLPGTGVTVIPQLLPSHPECVAVQERLAQPGGETSPEFLALKEHFKQAFRRSLEGCDVVFVHNVLTMHFNLAATAAIWEVADELPGIRFVSWVHDLSAVNPDYDLPRLGAYPWNLIAQVHPRIETATISDRRRRQFCKLMSARPGNCPVVSNGIEFLKVLQLTPNVGALLRQFGLLYRDIVIIHPARILRRKNIECGVRVLAELKKLGKSCCYLVTAAADPHHAASRDYESELHELVTECDLERDFHFVSERFRVSDRDLNSLYLASDLLFLPSRQEGFGLPLLEAGLFRIPVFCPRIEPMQSILRHNVHLFDLDDPPASVAERVVQVLTQTPGYHARKEVMQKYSWERLWVEKIEPLFFSTRGRSRVKQSVKTG